MLMKTKSLKSDVFVILSILVLNFHYVLILCLNQTDSSVNNNREPISMDVGCLLLLINVFFIKLTKE